MRKPFSERDKAHARADRPPARNLQESICRGNGLQDWLICGALGAVRDRNEWFIQMTVRGSATLEANVNHHGTKGRGIDTPGAADARLSEWQDRKTRGIIPGTTPANSVGGLRRSIEKLPKSAKNSCWIGTRLHSLGSSHPNHHKAVASNSATSESASERLAGASGWCARDSRTMIWE
jgi:hypothetical protein